MDPPEVLAKFLRPTNTTQMTRSGSFTSRRTPFGGGPQRLDPLKSARYAIPVAAGALTPILDKEGHRYHGASFRPTIGVRELFLLAPSPGGGHKPTTADSTFPSSVRAMGYWGSHNVYTQPGSYRETTSPFKDNSMAFARKSASKLAPIKATELQGTYMTLAISPM